MKTTHFTVRMAAVSLLGWILSACSAMPDYQRPEVAVPAHYKEGLGADEGEATWKVAEPADGRLTQVDWEIFNDPTLIALQAQAMSANQELEATLASVKRARALVEEAQAERLPEVGVGAGATRQRTHETENDNAAALQTRWRAQVSIAYEVDLFGRVSSSIAASQADAESKVAHWNAMRLVVQADVAHHYFLVRQLDEEASLRDAAVQSRQRTLELVRSKYAEGVVTHVTVASAEAELAQAEAELVGTRQQRALTEHALAVLLGKLPSQFTLAAAANRFEAIAIPAGLPSSLLERRPDIAAAERAMVAENARIGIAKAAFFPSLSLTGVAGYEASRIGDLLNWSQRTFLLGPLVGTALNFALFDGGRRRARVAQAEDRYQEQLAKYRQVVLKAFQEVEDSLVSIRTSDERLDRLRIAAASASRAAEDAAARFQAGDVEYLQVLDTERSLLKQQIAVSRAQGDRMRMAVDMVRALGGGWPPLSSLQVEEITLMLQSAEADRDIGNAK